MFPPPPPNPVAYSGTVPDWLASPVHAFDAWLAQQFLSAGTKQVYSAMWKKFALWLKGRSLRLDQVRAMHVWEFLEKACLNKTRRVGQPIQATANPIKERKEHRQRYVRLIERAYDHLIELGLNMENPGRKAGVARMGAGVNAPTKFLGDRECQRLFGAIQQFLVLPIPEWSDRDYAAWTKEWSAARDICLAGVMVGAGVRVEEVERLTVNCTYKTGTPAAEGDEALGRLWVPGAVGVQGREALCFPVAEMALASWATWRKAMDWVAETDLLFPANIRLRRHDLAAGLNESMHPSTVFRRVSRVLTEAGITGSRVGGQTLRNTYAAMLVELGCNDMEILTAMGLKTARSVLRLREKLGKKV